MAEHFNCKDMDALSRLFGKYWAYQLKDLTAALIPEVVTGCQASKQAGMYGKGLMQSHLIENSKHGSPSKHTLSVIVLGDEQHPEFLAYDRASWNDLIFHAMACKQAWGNTFKRIATA
jgi:hypothetical protein